MNGIALMPFERDIVESLEARGRSMPRSAAWIKGHLSQGEDYVYRMWQGYLSFCRHIETYLISPPSYDAFRRQIWMLHQEGIITPTRTEPGTKGGPFPRTYYSLV